jgi:hypothetical protein
MPEANSPRSFAAQNILRVILVASFIGVCIWQYQIVSGGERGVKQASTEEELSFKLFDGGTVLLPQEDADRYTVLICWNSGSERSLKLVDEAAELAQNPEIDSIAQFYLLNLSEDQETIARAVDIDRYSNLIGYDPSGGFVGDYQRRALPLTLVYNRKGRVISQSEGFEEGQLTDRIERLLTSVREGRAGSDIQFQF